MTSREGRTTGLSRVLLLIAAAFLTLVPVFVYTLVEGRVRIPVHLTLVPAMVVVVLIVGAILLLLASGEEASK